MRENIEPPVDAVNVAISLMFWSEFSASKSTVLRASIKPVAFVNRHPVYGSPATQEFDRFPTTASRSVIVAVDGDDPDPRPK